jgi:stearoyl-CoA desaturase (delta-9 desaturase)
LLRDKTLTFFHTHYWKINIAYSVLLFVCFGLTGVLIGHWVPAAMTWHGVSIVNAVSHTPVKVPKIIGYRNFNDTGEYSKNIPLAGLITFGEAYHNNHHGDPSNPSFSLKWWEFDLIGKIAVFIRNAHN